MRLNKFLSETGAWSRRGADQVIEEGRVTVNGVKAGLGTQVNDGDDVKVDGKAVGASRKQVAPVYIALNKPVGITCTTERHIEGNIIDFVDHHERIFPIGRLDKDSQGLILLTNDGDIVNQVLRVENAHEKEYVVSVDRPLTEQVIRNMERGVQMLDTVTLPCKITQMGPRTMRIVLMQGLNRQIRRMCAAFDYKVQTLERVRFMHIHLGSLKRGAWRDLTADEVAKLQAKPVASGLSKLPAPAAAAPTRPSRTKNFGGGAGRIRKPNT